MQPLKAQLSDTEWQQQYQRRLEDVSLTSRKLKYNHRSSIIDHRKIKMLLFLEDITPSYTPPM